LCFPQRVQWYSVWTFVVVLKVGHEKEESRKRKQSAERNTVLSTFFFLKALEMRKSWGI
jgi:hypothetical protein